MLSMQYFSIHSIHGTRFILVLSFILLGACISHPENPSFPVTKKQGKEALEAMSHAPAEMKRPLLILGGIIDPGVGSRSVHLKLRSRLHGQPLIVVTFASCTSFDQCRRRIFDRLEKSFPQWQQQGDSPEVDVVGISMGGLVARYAALPGNIENAPRLKIQRLYTIASPHRGALLANNIAKVAGPMIPYGLYKALQSNSDVVQRIRHTTPDYEIYPYIRLDDDIIGEVNSSPENQGVWWVSGAYWQEPAHLMATRDPRIIADIARSLRGETRFALGSPAPLPVKFR